MRPGSETDFFPALDLSDAAFVHHDLDGAEAQLAHQARERIEHFLGYSRLNVVYRSESSAAHRRDRIALQ